MDLFSYSNEKNKHHREPLASKMRPRNFDQFVGQTKLVGENSALRRMVQSGRIQSMIFWGPPGTGKTSLALLISSLIEYHFDSLSAVESGVSDLRRSIFEANERFTLNNIKTVLFIDEVHRFNKAQQDVILPSVEDGTVVLIGATTENPSFEINAPLLSRARIFTLESLTEIDIKNVIMNAINDSERGFGSESVEINADALDFLVEVSNGDARSTLNILEMAFYVSGLSTGNTKIITLDILKDVVSKTDYYYDKDRDQHYDIISAFIKSIRGSDPDAAIYWLARMIQGGEDPVFIARRLVILASEDIGLADPHAISVAIAAQQAVSFVGMPEGKFTLAHATIFLATRPKSNSAKLAIDAAINEVDKSGSKPVPLHLRNAVTSDMKKMGYGEGYKYSHNYDNHFAKMPNLPEDLSTKGFYYPSDQGSETQVKKWLEKLWGIGESK